MGNTQRRVAEAAVAASQYRPTGITVANAWLKGPQMAAPMFADGLSALKARDRAGHQRTAQGRSIRTQENPSGWAWQAQPATALN